MGDKVIKWADKEETIIYVSVFQDENQLRYFHATMLSSENGKTRIVYNILMQSFITGGVSRTRGVGVATQKQKTERRWERGKGYELARSRLANNATGC
jgi:hypothetical protein